MTSGLKRPPSPEATPDTERSIRDHDEERLRLDAAVKANDGFFTTFLVSPYSKYIARWAARRGLTPNIVTAVSMAVGTIAAAAFATGERPGLIAGAVLLQVAFTLDCVDGQLARYTRTFSKLGGWLDSMVDRAKEYLVFAGLAVGSIRGFGDDVWVLAAAALALQTARHVLDFSFNESRRSAEAGAGQPSPDSLRALDRRDWTSWVRKVIVLPIGERFALISLTAALFTPRTTFIVLLAWAGAATLYAGIGRVLRSLAGTTEAAETLALYRDDGPLARLASGVLGTRRSGRLSWLVPPLLRAVEYGTLLTLAALHDDAAVPACFALLATLAFRHYDLVYRIRHQGGPPAHWVRALGGGWDGRVLIAGVLFATGALTVGLYAAAAVLAVASVGESVAAWRRFGRG